MERCMGQTNLKAIVNESREVYRGRVFQLLQETVTLPNGLTTKLELIRHPGAAAVVPMLSKSQVVLIRQYRHAVGSVIWEIPAGTLDPGEDPVHCARRETIEEIGYNAGNMQRIGEIVPVPGYSDERIHIFLATDLRKVPQRLEDDEVLNVEELPFLRALEMIGTGEIVDAKTIIGLLRASAYLKERAA
jgi:ADP-ribose pyrophosphatase